MNTVFTFFSVLAVFSYLMYPSYAAPTTFQKEQILIAHNNIRISLGLTPLVWDSDIAESARKWAEELARSEKFDHSNPEMREYMGENLYYIVTTAKSLPSNGGDAVAAWAKEEQYYNYSSNTCAPGYECGHYKQIIWKDTTRIGCGRAKRKDDDSTTIYWVCRYDPAGNYRGVKPY